VVFLSLLLESPSDYRLPKVANVKQVSPYLTNELSPQVYNGVQRGEPFNLVVQQRGINEIVAHSKWPKEYEGIRFMPPKVFFIPDNIILMGVVQVGGAGFLVTLVVEPTIHQNGLLNLRLRRVRIGALNVTPLAKAVGRQLFAKRLAKRDFGAKDLRHRIVSSLLSDRAFEPVFEIENKRVRIERIEIEQEKLILRFVPAGK